MHKAQRGEKLSVVRQVLTTLNFVTTPSFSVTTPSCEPGVGAKQSYQPVRLCRLTNSDSLYWTHDTYYVSKELFFLQFRCQASCMALICSQERTCRARACHEAHKCACCLASL